MTATPAADSETISLETLEAVLNRVLPGEPGPGARRADAVRCAAWLLGHPAYRDWRRGAADGLKLVDEIALALNGRPFARCAACEQDAALAVVASTPHPQAQRTLSLMIGLAIRGVYADSRYGGNRDREGWRHAGFDPRWDCEPDAPLAGEGDR